MHGSPPCSVCTVVCPTYHQTLLYHLMVDYYALSTTSFLKLRVPMKATWKYGHSEQAPSINWRDPGEVDPVTARPPGRAVRFDAHPHRNGQARMVQHKTPSLHEQVHMKENRNTSLCTLQHHAWSGGRGRRATPSAGGGA